MATTHLDMHNEIISKEALEGAANQINSDRKPIFTVEHDTALPPIGKVLRAWIEPLEDSEYQLLAEVEIFEKDDPLMLPDGSQGLVRQSNTDHHPFVSKEENVPEQITLKVDHANFASQEEYEAFIEDLHRDSSLPFQTQLIGRKAYIPDVEAIITLGRELLAYLAFRKIIDKFGDKASDKLSDELSNEAVSFYIWVKTTAIKLAKYTVPKNYPITYVFSVPINPHVELVARTSDASEVAASIMEDNLEKPLKQAMEFRDRLGAESVQYLLDKTGEWKFNYLLTNKGKVIGTRKSFSRKARQIDFPISANLTTTGTNRPRQYLGKARRKNRRGKRKP